MQLLSALAVVLVAIEDLNSVHIMAELEQVACAACNQQR